MKKYFLLIWFCVVSCAAEDRDRHNVRFVEHAKGFESRYMKPSEAMQVGLPKMNILDLRFDQDADSYVENVQSNDSYKIFNVAYFPQKYAEFEETGGASWYGADFHGKYTANGEIYDSGAMTAAHRTLSLPSMVRVTNLRNGRSVIVRVNDRGPFSKDRIIDVSEKAAEELGFKDQGTTKVYIQLLRDDSDEMIKKMKIKN